MMPLSTPLGVPSRRGFRQRRMLRWLLAALGLGALVLLGRSAWEIGPEPEVGLRPGAPALGRNSTLQLGAREGKRGLSRVRLELVQEGRATILFEESFSLESSWFGLHSGPRDWSSELRVGSDTTPTLREGEAQLRWTAWGAPAWLREPRSRTEELSLPVLLVPPRLELLSSQHHAVTGGSEAVVYRVGATAVRDGVEAGPWFFPGAPLPGNNGARFALFAVPVEGVAAREIRLVATDAAGNSSTLAFLDGLREEPLPLETIRLTLPLLERLTREILAREQDRAPSADPLADFLWINRELRRRNNDHLLELGRQSREEFLWRAPFLPLPGGKVMSRFASRRTYLFGDRSVDEQIHLGFDLASIARADVPAANDGIVVFADWLGIYGLAVLLDHGHGLMSFYAHLSEIRVAPGQRVRRSELLGRTGMTGLAGGDHLHFSFLLRGIPVRPLEWWDARWIQHRLVQKLGTALPFLAP